jgi:hypothetical protein
MCHPCPRTPVTLDSGPNNVTVSVTAGKDSNRLEDVKLFRQTLRFPLRIGRDQGMNALPYRPTFILFEDPEYNRRLATSSAQQSGLVTLPVGAESQVFTVTLAADRREYNTAGRIHYLFFADRAMPNGTTGSIQISRFRSGSTQPLHTVAGLPSNSLPPASQDMDLAEIVGQFGLHPDDTLLLVLTIGTSTIELAVSIVGQSVTPPPDAGYSLLRRDPDLAVQCCRFAFSPIPARIELVDPNDLKQVVRRRAVFRWADTRRLGQQFEYAIQKWTTTGSTHFPVV